MTLVKICGVTTVDDARVAADCGADAIGLNFWPGSVRYLDLERAAEIAAQIPPHVLRVGVFVDATEEMVRAATAVAGLQVAQLHGTSAAPPGTRLWRACAAGSFVDDPTAEAFLVDTPAGSARGGTGRTFDWSLARGLPGRIILAGGLGPDNVQEAIRAVRPWGVDACSRLESSPGRKDWRKIEEFVQAVRAIES